MVICSWVDVLPLAYTVLIIDLISYDFGCFCARLYLVTEADGQLVERHRMRAVGFQEHLELDGLVYVETGRQEPGLTLDWRQQRERLNKLEEKAVVFFMLLQRAHL